MAYQILVVDDEPALRMMVQEILTQAGYAVCLAGSCREALTQRAQVHPDAILLDVMLPDGDGFSLLGQLRQQGDVPVLFLSARDEDEARLRGLGLGADDYITKPFSMRELLARVKANIRRTEVLQDVAAQTAPGPQEHVDQIVQGRIRIDTGAMVVYKDGMPLDLTQREYELLTFLASHPNKVYSRIDLMEQVWNYGYVGDDVRTVDVTVRRLREKIEADPANPVFILTRRGAGYYFSVK